MCACARRAQYLDIGNQDDAIPFRDLKVSTRVNRIWLVLPYNQKAETKCEKKKIGVPMLSLGGPRTLQSATNEPIARRIAPTIVRWIRELPQGACVARMR